MRVAVTGGAGFIGSVVGEVLTREQHDVLVLDNLSKGHRDAVMHSQFAQIDLLDQAAVASQLRQFRCEAVIHLAADSLVGESVLNPGKYYRNNIVGGLSLLDAMRQADVRRLVFSMLPYTENHRSSLLRKTTRRILRIHTERPNSPSSERCSGTRQRTESARLR